MGSPSHLDQFGAFSGRGTARHIQGATQQDPARRTAVQRWWERPAGVPIKADWLLVAADAGGPNGYRDRLWKTELARAAGEMGLSRLREASLGALGTGFSSQR
jgi:Rhodopirellula transposase DDE domain